MTINRFFIERLPAPRHQLMMRQITDNPVDPFRVKDYNLWVEWSIAGFDGADPPDNDAGDIARQGYEWGAHFRGNVHEL